MMTTDRLTRLRALREADPSDADIPYMLAQELAKEGEHDEALALYDACLALDAHYHYAYFHKARLLETLERLDEAADMLRQGLAKSREAGDAKAMGEIGQFLSLLERNDA